MVQPFVSRQTGMDGHTLMHILKQDKAFYQRRIPDHGWIMVDRAKEISVSKP